jgi:M6 family metalloprotease-like protein
MLIGFLAVLLMAASALAIDLSRGIILDVPERVIEKQFGKLPPTELSAEEMKAIASFRFETEELRVLAIPVEWDDRPQTYSTAVLDSMMFSRDVYPGGSVADYFHEASYGQVSITGDVIDWYNAGTYSSWFDFEDILPAIDDLVDFSLYDGNGDGDVDAVVFIRSGTGEEDSQDPDDIWSYAYVYGQGGGPGPFDGVMVSRWNTSPELFPMRNPANPTEFTGADTLNHIRVFCHELTHNFGLPDLYDYDEKLTISTYNTPNDDNDHPLVDWCLMGYYGYGYLSIGSEVPSHLCGWSKKSMGWVEPIELIGTHENVVIYNIETRPDSSLYLVPINPGQGEYFLLEYRNPQSTGLFDKTDSDFSVFFWPDLTYGADTLDRGLMITHVHDSVTPGWWPINEGLPEYPHYTVIVEDAGYNPAMDEYSNPEGHVTDSAQWWYPWETRKGALFSSDVPGQDQFGPATYPSSDGYNHVTGIFVRVDSIVDDKLYAYVHNPYGDQDNDGINDIADNCLGLFNPDQANDDTDSLGNACDNCPSEFNPDQADSNGDGIGDACNYRWPVWDTIATACLNLTVGNTGNMGNGYSPGVSMDYLESGDCDPYARVYMFDGSPLISYYGGPLYYSMYNNQLFHLVLDRNFPVATQTTADYDIYESGTFVTPDSFIALEKTWWAPKAPDSCTFIIQRLRVYSYDGLSHANIAICEAFDWDIPSDNGVDNIGGYDSTNRMLYVQGMEINGTGCQPNDGRYGAMAMMAHYINDTAFMDTAGGPFSAYILDYDTYVLSPFGWHEELIATTIDNPGYHVVASETDLTMIMAFFYDHTIEPDDTLNIFTVLTTVMNDSLPASGDKSTGQLLTNIAKAKQWTNDHVVTLLHTTYVCGDANGDDDVNIADAVFLIAYVFKGGPAPDPPCVGDANGDDDINIGDAVYLISYVFKGGPPPVEPCCP